MKSKFLLVLTLGVASSLSGCSLTPAPTPVPIIERIEDLPAYDAEVPDGLPTTLQGWWTEIAGDEMQDLVEELLASSLILKEARQQVVQASERATQATGQRLPAIGYNIDRTRSRSPDFSGNFSWIENYTAGINVSFDTDVWGRLRATERAALLTAEAVQYSYLANEQLEIARLVRNWISAVTLSNQLALARDTAAIFETTYDLTDQRYRAGSQSASASDVLIA